MSVEMNTVLCSCMNRTVSGDNSRVGFRVDIEDYLYNGDFGGGNDFQNDLVTSLGVSIALGGRASD